MRFQEPFILFRTQFAVDRHTNAIHLKLRPWQCDLCEKRFGSKRDKERHRKSVHLQEKGEEGRRSWSCPLCNIQFEKRSLYDKYVIFHTI